MRSLRAWCVGGLLLGASVAGCVDHSEQPLAPGRAEVVATPQPQATSTGAVHRSNAKGVTEAQPATHAAQPRGSQPPVQDRLIEERARVSQGVTLATQQIDRLTRMQQYADPDRQTTLQSTIDDLQSRREKVLQDMRELEIRGPAFSAMASDTLRSDLYRDLDDLQSSVQESYALAPPPGSGMAPPAPLPPGPMH